jgi:excinuclease ABC subunit B
MQKAIDETNRRREIQMAYNKEHNITPTTIRKEIRDVIQATVAAEDQETYQKKITSFSQVTKKNRPQVIEQLEKEMREAAKSLDFEKAAELRDIVFELKAEG